MLDTLYQCHVIEVGYYFGVVLLFDLYVLEVPETVENTMCYGRVLLQVKLVVVNFF